MYGICDESGVTNYSKSSLPPIIKIKTPGNFSKFLIKDGQPIKRYGPTDAPLAFAKDIEAALK